MNGIDAQTLPLQGLKLVLIDKLFIVKV